MELAERLIGKGFDVRIYDPVVNPARLIGANRRHVESKLPHLGRLLTHEPAEALSGADVAIVSSVDPAIRAASARQPAASPVRPERPAGPRDRVPPRLRGDRLVNRVLIIVQNLPVPFDRRVWLECQALVSAGYQVCRRVPQGQGRPGLRGHRRACGCTSTGPTRPAAASSSFITEYAYSFLATAWLTLKARRSGRFAVIQACNPPDIFWPIALVLRALDRTRFVFDHHDLCPELYQSRFPDGPKLPYRGLRALERRTHRTADHVISTNDSYRDIAISAERQAGRRRHGRPDRPGPGAAAARRAQPELRRGRRFLAAYIGVMGPQDGVDIVVRAADIVVHQLGRDDIAFTLIGSGDCFDDLVALRDELGLAGHVEFTGRAPDELVGAHHVHRGRRLVARPQESAQRRVDDEQNHGIHGLRAARGRV